MPERTGAALSHPRRIPDTTCLAARSTVFQRLGLSRGRAPHESRAPWGAPTPGRLQGVCPGTGQHLDALGDDLTGAAILPLLLPPPPLQAPLDQDAAAFAQRGSHRCGLMPEGDHLDTADVGMPGVPLADAGRHGDTVPRHRHPVWRIAHLGVLRQIAEEVHAMQRGHMVVSCGAPLGETGAEATMRWPP